MNWNTNDTAGTHSMVENEISDLGIWHWSILRLSWSAATSLLLLYSLEEIFSDFSKVSLRPTDLRQPCFEALEMDLTATRQQLCNCLVRWPWRPWNSISSHMSCKARGQLRPTHALRLSQGQQFLGNADCIMKMNKINLRAGACGNALASLCIQDMLQSRSWRGSTREILCWKERRLIWVPEPRPCSRVTNLYYDVQYYNNVSTVESLLLPFGQCTHRTM